MRPFDNPIIEEARANRSNVGKRSILFPISDAYDFALVVGRGQEIGGMSIVTDDGSGSGFVGKIYAPTHDDGPFEVLVLSMVFDFHKAGCIADTADVGRSVDVHYA